MNRWLIGLLAGPLAIGACKNDASNLLRGAGDDSLGVEAVDPGAGPVPAGLPGQALASKAPALRRLTHREFELTASAFLGVPVSAEVLPRDARTPFDNDYSTQAISDAFVRPLESMAEKLAASVIADPAKRDAVVGCVPTGPGDVECFTSFVKHFGRLALRRPLETDEVLSFTALIEVAKARNDFYVAVDLALRSFLQHPEFLYRVEVGSLVGGSPGLVKLNGFEVATRLAFFLTGAGPSDALLDRAAAGKLDQPQGIRNAAAELLATPAARAQVLRMFQMWMGYERLAQPDPLANAMRTESDALVEKVIFDDNRPWLDVFRSTETYISDALATVYELPLPGAQPKWVSFGPGRKGLLSQGSLLSNGQKFGDTSPTQRGKWILEQITCDGVLPTPPGLKLDEPPKAETANACKHDRYMALQANPSCASCHKSIDGIGFGLEGYDETGKRRKIEPGRPDCAIDGKGNIPGAGAFSGPAELTDLLLKSGKLSQCMFKQVKRFANGRRELDSADEEYVGSFSKQYSGEVKMKDFLLDMVSSEAFGSRRSP